MCVPTDNKPRVGEEGESPGTKRMKKSTTTTCVASQIEGPRVPAPPREAIVTA